MVPLEPLPARLPSKPLFAQCRHRAGSDTLSAFLSGLEEAGLIRLHERVVSKLGLGDQAPALIYEESHRPGGSLPPCPVL
jgi:hypothetical protein